jgi:hypothetical protein
MGVILMSPSGFADNVVAPRATLFFTSQGKTGTIGTDGKGLEYLHFSIPNQATWQPGPIFSDGRRVVVLSMEPRRDGPGKPFEDYYTQTPTHVWVYDTQTKSLDEIARKDRLAPFETPCALIDDRKLLMQVVRDKVGQVFLMNLDGSEPHEFTRADEGLPYGFSLSPDQKRVAFHLAGPNGYEVYTSDIDGSRRTKVAGQPGHLYFGTDWSPDGLWITYVDCRPADDPGHDWADVCVGKADGSEHRVITSNGSMWFAASYGNENTRGGGSNIPAWSKRGTILFPKRSATARVAWRYRVGQPDLDHFNRAYEPEKAVGGTCITEIDPFTGASTDLTEMIDGDWDFRATPSPDGKRLLFCRARMGEAPSIWVMNADGREQRRLTAGIDDQGADHPRWIPTAP